MSLRFLNRTLSRPLNTQILNRIPTPHPRLAVPTRKRCPNGQRKHRVTRVCTPKSIRTRCPNGQRKHRVTKICTPY